MPKPKAHSGKPSGRPSKDRVSQPKNFHKQINMDEVKIKRVKRNKKQATTSEKILAGVGVASTLMGGAGAVSPKSNTQAVVRSQADQQGSGVSKVKAALGKIFGDAFGGIKQAHAMTKEEARVMLSTGQGTPEQLNAANIAYYGKTDTNLATQTALQQQATTNSGAGNTSGSDASALTAEQERLRVILATGQVMGADGKPLTGQALADALKAANEAYYGSATNKDPIYKPGSVTNPTATPSVGAPVVNGSFQSQNGQWLNLGGGGYYDTKTGTYSNADGTIQSTNRNDFSTKLQNSYLNGFSYKVDPKSAGYNPAQYASRETALALAHAMGLQDSAVVLTTVSGPVAPLPQYLITLPNGVQLNAGLVAQTYLNNPPAVADEMIKAEISNGGGKYIYTGADFGGGSSTNVTDPNAVVTSPAASRNKADLVGAGKMWATVDAFRVWWNQQYVTGGDVPGLGAKQDWQIITGTDWDLYNSATNGTTSKYSPTDITAFANLAATTPLASIDQTKLMEIFGNGANTGAIPKAFTSDSAIAYALGIGNNAAPDNSGKIQGVNGQWYQRSGNNWVSVDAPANYSGVNSNNVNNVIYDGSAAMNAQIAQLKLPAGQVTQMQQSGVVPGSALAYMLGIGNDTIHDMVSGNNGTVYYRDPNTGNLTTRNTQVKVGDSVTVDGRTGAYKTVDGKVTPVENAGHQVLNSNGYYYTSDGNNGWTLTDHQVKNENGHSYVSQGGEWLDAGVNSSAQIYTNVNIAGLHAVDLGNGLKQGTIGVNGNRLTMNVAVTSDGRIYDEQGNDITTLFTDSAVQQVVTAFNANMGTGGGEQGGGSVGSRVLQKSGDELGAGYISGVTYQYGNGNSRLGGVWAPVAGSTADGSSLNSAFGSGYNNGVAYDYLNGSWAARTRTVDNLTQTFYGGQWVLNNDQKDPINHPGLITEGGKWITDISGSKATTTTRLDTTGGRSVHQILNVSTNQWTDAPQAGDVDVKNGVLSAYSGSQWIKQTAAGKIIKDSTGKITNYQITLDGVVFLQDSSLDGLSQQLQQYNNQPNLQGQLFAAYYQLLNAQSTGLTKAPAPINIPNTPAWQSFKSSPASFPTPMLKADGSHDWSQYTSDAKMASQLDYNYNYFNNPNRSYDWGVDDLGINPYVLNNVLRPMYGIPVPGVNNPGGTNRFIVMPDGQIIPAAMGITYFGAITAHWTKDGLVQDGSSTLILARSKLSAPAQQALDNAFSGGNVNPGLPAGIGTGNTGGSYTGTIPGGAIVVGPVAVTSTGSMATGLTFKNTTSNDNAILAVNDSWQLEITGPVGKQVYITGGKIANGVVPNNTTLMGIIGANNKLVLTGKITSDAVGTWNQTVKIGDDLSTTTQLPTLMFTVIANRPTGSGGGAGAGVVSDADKAMAIAYFQSGTWPDGTVFGPNGVYKVANNGTLLVDSTGKPIATKTGTGGAVTPAEAAKNTAIINFQSAPWADGTTFGIYRVTGNGLQLVDQNGTSIATKTSAGNTVTASAVLTLATGTVGTVYNASMPTGGIWSKTSGNLPPGIAYNASSGTFSGIPTTAGSYNFVMQKTGAANTTTVTLVVNPSVTTSTPTTLTLNPATINRPYSASISASAPGTWIQTSPSTSLPPGITYSSTGTFSGTPTTAGTYTIVLGKAGTIDTITVTLIVNPPAATSNAHLVAAPDGLLSRDDLSSGNGGLLTLDDLSSGNGGLLSLNDLGQTGAGGQTGTGTGATSTTSGTTGTGAIGSTTGGAGMATGASSATTLSTVQITSVTAFDLTGRNSNNALKAGYSIEIGGNNLSGTYNQIFLTANGTDYEVKRIVTTNNKIMLFPEFSASIPNGSSIGIKLLSAKAGVISGTLKGVAFVYSKTAATASIDNLLTVDNFASQNNNLLTLAGIGQTNQSALLKTTDVNQNGNLLQVADVSQAGNLLKATDTKQAQTHTELLNIDDLANGGLIDNNQLNQTDKASLFKTVDLGKTVDNVQASSLLSVNNLSQGKLLNASDFGQTNKDSLLKATDIGQTATDSGLVKVIDVNKDGTLLSLEGLNKNSSVLLRVNDIKTSGSILKIDEVKTTAKDTILLKAADTSAPLLKADEAAKVSVSTADQQLITQLQGKVNDLQGRIDSLSSQLASRQGGGTVVVPADVSGLQAQVQQLNNLVQGLRSGQIQTLGNVDTHPLQSLQMSAGYTASGAQAGLASSGGLQMPAGYQNSSGGQGLQIPQGYQNSSGGLQMPQSSGGQIQGVSRSSAYTVKKGDTLLKIAQKFYGKDGSKQWRKILSANPKCLTKVNDTKTLKVGFELNIPLT